MNRYRYKGRSFGGARKAPSFGEVGLGKWGSICSLGGGDLGQRARFLGSQLKVKGQDWNLSPSCPQHGFNAVFPQASPSMWIPLSLW